MVAPAPGLLSTTTGCPRTWDSGCASARASTSVVPPAGNGTIRLMGLLGQACAMALLPEMASVNAMACVMRRREMMGWVVMLVSKNGAVCALMNRTLGAGADAESHAK